MDSLKVYNTIRALSDPYPNAFTYYRDNKIQISKSKILNYKKRIKPGYFKRIGKKIVANCLFGQIIFKTNSKKVPKADILINFYIIIYMKVKLSKVSFSQSEKISFKSY